MIIIIKNLKVKGMLGVYEEEKHAKQTVIVNAEIDFDEGPSIESDNIEDTLDYHPICNEISRIISEGNYELLEKMLNDIGKFILSDEKVNWAYVRLDKPEAPIENIDAICMAKKFERS